MQLYPNDLANDLTNDLSSGLGSTASGGADAAEGQLLCGMNTTPLIDVMLVLIVMLIITIPAQLNSVALDMPNATSAPTPPSIIRLDIAQTGAVLADGIPMPDRAALSALLVARSTGAAPEVHIHPNSAAPYAAVASVLALTQQLGLAKVGMGGN